MTTILWRILPSLTAIILLNTCGQSEAGKLNTTAEIDSTLNSGSPLRPQSPRLIDSQIIADKFDLQYELTDDQLTITLETDLGDATKLMVSISRSYWELGSEVQYPIDYFRELTTIGAWRSTRTLSINQTNWENELLNLQRTLASSGEPFEISRISDNLDISFIVPINQDPPYERFNDNLVGSVVMQSGNLRIVRQKVSIHNPFLSENKQHSRYTNRHNLAIGSKYRASREVPIIMELDPKDSLAAISSIRYLKVGEAFQVIEITKRDNTLWYRVKANDYTGWVNSDALLGQEILEIP